MFLLKGLLTLSQMETFLPCGRNYLCSVEVGMDILLEFQHCF